MSSRQGELAGFDLYYCLSSFPVIEKCLNYFDDLSLKDSESGKRPKLLRDISNECVPPWPDDSGVSPAVNLNLIMMELLCIRSLLASLVSTRGNVHTRAATPATNRKHRTPPPAQ